MRNESHESWIKVIRTEVEAYRVDMGWSREAVVDRIVTIFKETECSNAWGIEFSNHADTFQRQKNDALQEATDERPYDELPKETSMLTEPGPARLKKRVRNQFATRVRRSPMDNQDMA